MKLTPLRIVLAAGVAGALGLVAGVLVNGPGPLAGTEPGQRLLNDVVAATATGVPDDLPVARRGQPLPRIVLDGLDGVPIVLPDAYRGRVVLVNAWASWCGPCIEEMPELDRFARSQGEDGVVVLGLALDEAEAVADFLARIPVGYRQAIDQPGPRDASVQLGNLRGVLPYTVLIAADGRVRKQKIGPFSSGEIEGWAAD